MEKYRGRVKGKEIEMEGKQKVGRRKGEEEEEKGKRMRGGKEIDMAEIEMDFEKSSERKRERDSKEQAYNSVTYTRIIILLLTYRHFALLLLSIILPSY